MLISVAHVCVCRCEVEAAAKGLRVPMHGVWPALCLPAPSLELVALVVVAHRCCECARGASQDYARLDEGYAFAQVLFVLAAMAATFLLVPRGFSAGEIDIQADKMSWNVRPCILMQVLPAGRNAVYHSSPARARVG